MPIYQTSVFAHDDAAELTASLNDPRGDFGYSRNGNPTVRSLELAVAGLENAAGAVATSSGMGAISVALGAHLRAGSHVVVQQSLYGGTAALLRDMVNRWQIRISEVPGDDPDALAAVLSGGADVVMLETISNPMTAVADIARMAAVAKDAGAVTVVDNTFASPMLCRPLDLGADVVVGGHRDDIRLAILEVADRGGSGARLHLVLRGVARDLAGDER